MPRTTPHSAETRALMSEGQRKAWAGLRRQQDAAELERRQKMAISARPVASEPAMIRLGDLPGNTMLRCGCGASFFPAPHEKLGLRCNCRAFRVELIIAERQRFAAD